MCSGGNMEKGQNQAGGALCCKQQKGLELTLSGAAAAARCSGRGFGRSLLVIPRHTHTPVGGSGGYPSSLCVWKPYDSRATDDGRLITK